MRYRWKHVDRANPYLKEFRDDVVNVAHKREPGQDLRQITADFGISESWLTNWMKAARRPRGQRMPDGFRC